MRKIDPALLRAYVVVMETGSLKPAARLADRTISAVSYQLLRLEKVLGQKLFTRHGKALMPSAAGLEFLKQAKAMLLIHDQALANRWNPAGSVESDLATPSIMAKNVSNTSAAVGSIGNFAENLETKLLRNVYSIWKSYRADGKTLSLSELTNSGVMANPDYKIDYFYFEQAEHRCAYASEGPTRLFELDRYGFGVPLDQLWRSPKIYEPRRKIISICKDADVPVFFQEMLQFHGIQNIALQQ